MPPQKNSFRRFLDRLRLRSALRTKGESAVGRERGRGRGDERLLFAPEIVRS